MSINPFGWRSLGSVALTPNPQTIAQLFPAEVGNVSNNCCLVRIQMHEDDAAGDLVYVGNADLDLGGARAGYILRQASGRDVFDVENQNAQNTLDLDQIALIGRPEGTKVRISFMVS